MIKRLKYQIVALSTESGENGKHASRDTPLPLATTEAATERGEKPPCTNPGLGVRILELAACDGSALFEEDQRRASATAPLLAGTSQSVEHLAVDEPHPGMIGELHDLGKHGRLYAPAADGLCIGSHRGHEASREAHSVKVNVGTHLDPTRATPVLMMTGA
jgi:hypothetical protein